MTVTANDPIPAELVSFVKGFEGWSATPYQDVAGHWTIGWGHLLPDGVHDPIDYTQGEVLLRSDLLNAWEGAIHVSPFLEQDSEHRRMAITDFCFNLGANRYAGSTLRKRVDAGSWDLAAAECRKWVYAGGKIQAGLVKRREQEAIWLFEG